MEHGDIDWRKLKGNAAKMKTHEQLENNSRFNFLYLDPPPEKKNHVIFLKYEWSCGVIENWNVTT